MARSVACLLSAGVTPHDTDLFMSLQLTQPTATENTATQGGKYFNNSDVPTPFRSYSPHSLERRGMNTGMSGLLCDHPLCSGQAVWSGEGHGKGSEYPMSSASQPLTISAIDDDTSLCSESLTRQIIVPRLASHGH